MSTSNTTTKQTLKLLHGSCLCGTHSWKVHVGVPGQDDSNHDTTTDNDTTIDNNDDNNNNDIPIIPVVSIGQVLVCHCSMCCKYSGSVHGIPHMALPKQAILPQLLQQQQEQQSALSMYESSPGVAQRCFCKKCASGMYMEYSHEEDTVWIPMGTLDMDVLVKDDNDNDDLLWLLDNSYRNCPSTKEHGSSSPSQPRDSHIFVNTGATRLQELLDDHGSMSMPRYKDFGTYRPNPCQPRRKSGTSGSFGVSSFEELPSWKDNDVLQALVAADGAAAKEKDDASGANGADDDDS